MREGGREGGTKTYRKIHVNRERWRDKGMQQAAELRDVFMDGGMMREKERGKETEKD